MAQNIGNRLVQAIIRQGDKAGYFCSADNISANQKVHELRRGFKRLRALMHFFDLVSDNPITQTAFKLMFDDASVETIKNTL